MSNISVGHNYPVKQTAAADLSTFVQKAGASISGDSVPQASLTAGKQSEPWHDALPLPQLPNNRLDLNVLFKALEEKDRREGINQAITNTQINGERRIEVLNERLEALKEAESSKGLKIASKVFGWIAAVAGVALSIATLGAAVGPLAMIGAGIGAAVGGVSLVQKIATEATDGKYQSGQLLGKLHQVCTGCSDEEAAKVGGIINMALLFTASLASIGCSIGALCSSGSKAALDGTKIVADTVEDVVPKGVTAVDDIAAQANKFSTIGKWIQGANTVTQIGSAGVNIAGGISTIIAGNKRADAKELEAILEEMRQKQEMNTEYIQKMLDDLNQNIGVVKDIVQDTQQTAQSLATIAPQMA